MDRINWTDWFMIQALWISQRSPDKSTQHGCVIVDKNNHMLSYGYNGYPVNVDDSKMPQTRPEKYPPILHSEENAIYNCNQSMEGATVYITGPPCIHCLAAMIQKRVSKIVYGHVKSANSKSPYLKDGPENDVAKLLLENQDIKMVLWEPDNAILIDRGFMYIQTQFNTALLS